MYIFRGKLFHRNRRLRNRRGFSVACSNGLSVACSNGISPVSGMLQMIVACPVDCYWNCPIDSRRHFPTGFHFCDIRRVICLYCTIAYYTTLYYTLLYYTILYYTILYHTILHYNILSDHTHHPAPIFRHVQHLKNLIV